MKLITTALVLFSCALMALPPSVGLPAQSSKTGPTPQPVIVGGGGGTEWVTGVTAFGTPLNSLSYGIGCRFTVGASDITVTHLGRWVISGNSQTHVIRLRDVSCVDIGNVTVDCNGATPGQFVYAALGTPVVLTAGGIYYIMADETASGDNWYFTTTTVTTTAVAGSVFEAYHDGICNLAASGSVLGPCSFKYSSP